jgi:type II secretory pathway component GspD/PulD (secretin)
LRYRRFRCFVLWAALAALPQAGAADQELRYIALSHRLPDELIPVVQPLLAPGEVVVAAGNQLLVKSSEETFRELTNLVLQLDTAPHRLLILVARGTRRDHRRFDADVRLSTESRNGGPRDDPAAPVRADGSISATQGFDATEVLQRVQTIDGQTAMIQIGEQRPAATRYLTPWTSGVVQGPGYSDLTTGFAVVPRLTGDQVTVRIEPWSARAASPVNDGRIDSESMSTTVRGQLGEWIELGGQLATQDTETRGIASGTASSRQRSDTLLLKVDDLDRAQPPR